MSDSPSKFSTVGAAAPDAVNDHPTLRFAHLTPERVVRVSGAERLALHALCIDAGASKLAAELERWMVPSELQRLSTVRLGRLARNAVTSEFVARIAAELEQRRRHALAAAELLRRPMLRHTSGAVRELVQLGADVRPAPVDTGREHAPIAERVTVRAVPRRGFIELRGWLVGSEPNTAGEPGTISVVKLPGHVHPLVVGTLETRLGW